MDNDKGVVMGQRGEIFSTRIFVDEGRKTYFFNLKENRFGDLYLNIVESRKHDYGFKRFSVVVFQEDMLEFIKNLNDVVSGIRRREKNIDREFSVGEDRRSYMLRLTTRGKPALQITEERVADSGSLKVSIYVPLGTVDIFLSGFYKAIKQFKDPILENEFPSFKVPLH